MLRLAVAAILTLLSLSTIGGAAAIGAVESPSRTLVLCHADDPYRGLAQDIARDEGLALVDSLEQALSAHPTFLLWVVSPVRLSGRAVTTFSAALAIVVLVPVAIRVWRGRVSWPLAVRALAIGLTAGVLHAAYGMGRQHEILTVIKPIAFSPLAAIATAVLTAAGAMLFFTARSRPSQVVAAGTAVLGGWAGAIAGPGIRMVSNVLVASMAGIDVWVYRVPWHPLVLSATGTVAPLLVCSAVSRRWPTDVRPHGAGNAH